MHRIYLLVLFIFTIGSADSQVIKGRVMEEGTTVPVPFASIYSKDSLIHAQCDSVGKFSLDANGKTEFVVRARDFLSLEITLPNPAPIFWEIVLVPGGEGIGTIEIKHDRQKQKQRESPVTVESLDSKGIKETPASDFYEGLGHLRGVDVTAASMGFRIINTRGFNSTSPVRSLQIIDGVDNQAPGLNFSLGNFLGCSELDVQNAEIIVGASSAYYGPNAFNGVISMTTKSPWIYKGLSAQIKVGERQLGQIMLRYANTINRNGKPVFAYKFSLLYMRAHDWEATNYKPTTDSKTDEKNPGGYDAVNRYGDEVFGTMTNDQVSFGSRVNTPGLGAYYRDGYAEKDLVNYNTRNLKTNLLLAYKINSRNEIQYGFNFGTGTTVYQGDNRYSLNDILFFQNRIELIGKKGFLRAYATHENAGNTYDAVLTAMLMQAKAKSKEDWDQDYVNYWLDKITPKVKSLPGYDTIGSPNKFNPKYNPFFFEEQAAILAKYRDSIVRWHGQTRAISNSALGADGTPHINPSHARYSPGTPEFEKEKNLITSTYSYGSENGIAGSRFFDQSAMYHLNGERKFAIKRWAFTTGFTTRVYTPYSKGTIFLDTGSERIVNKEAGIYGGFERRIWHKRLKLNGTIRFDKNQNFHLIFSPAMSLIYAKTKKNTYRMSFSHGVRNPTLQDQYLHYNVGRAILLGNIHGVKGVYELDNFISYIDRWGTSNPDSLIKIDVAPIKPEQCNTIEGGYKGFLMDGRLAIDMGAYYSQYVDFIGYRLVIDATLVNNYPSMTQIYRVASNSASKVYTYGASAGVNYFFSRFLMAGVNWTYNELNKKGTNDPLIPAYNTPKHKYNVSFGASDVVKTMYLGGKKININHFGFNTNFKWVDGFIYEGSPQFTGYVPTYWMLDVQLSQKIEKWKTTFKLGASNLTNNAVQQVFGGPRIGRMIYLGATLEP